MAIEQALILCDTQCLAHRRNWLMKGCYLAANVQKKNVKNVMYETICTANYSFTYLLLYLIVMCFFELVLHGTYLQFQVVTHH